MREWWNRGFERNRWRLWSLIVRHPKVCPVNAHSVMVCGIRDRTLLINHMCRTDCARNGTCWCGKLRTTEDVEQ